MTTKLEEILAGLVALLLICIGIGTWWHFHNADERKEGAAACVQATTQTKTEVIAENTADTTGQAADLKATVAQQNENLQKLSADNADLVKRLHDNALRPSTVPNSGRAAANNCDAGAVRSGQGDTGETVIAAAEVSVLNDCDAEHARADSAVKAYNDWRQRMIERSQKSPTAISVR